MMVRVHNWRQRAGVVTGRGGLRVGGIRLYGSAEQKLWWWTVAGWYHSDDVVARELAGVYYAFVSIWYNFLEWVKQGGKGVCKFSDGKCSSSSGACGSEGLETITRSAMRRKKDTTIRAETNQRHPTNAIIDK